MRYQNTIMLLQMLALPDDVLGAIFSFLTLSELCCRLLPVCKTANRIISDEMEPIRGELRVTSRHLPSPDNDAARHVWSVSMVSSHKIQNMRHILFPQLGRWMSSVKLGGTIVFSPTLKTLTLSVPFRSAYVIKHLQQLITTISSPPHLRELKLNLDVKHVRSHWMSVDLTPMTTLLDLSDLEFRCTGHSYLDELYALTEKQISVLRALPSLTRAHIFPCYLDNASVCKLLAPPHQLKIQDLGELDGTDELVATIAQVPTLSALNVDVRGRSVEFLNGLPHLKRLCLTGWNRYPCGKPQDCFGCTYMFPSHQLVFPAS